MLRKEDKLILETLRYLLWRHASDQAEPNKKRQNLLKEIDETLNSKKSEFPEIKKTLKEKPKNKEKF